MELGAAVLRAFQIVFAAVVLGLSVSVAKGQAPKGNFYEYDSNVPATTAYSSFVGGFGMFVAIVGIASLFVEFLQGIIMLVLDGLASLIFLAGGLAVAIGLRGVSCGNLKQEEDNDLINGGKWTRKGEDNAPWGDGIVDQRGPGWMKGRCQMLEADSAFMFLGFIVSLGLIAYAFFRGNRLGGKRTSAV